MISLRDYQRRAIDALYAYFQGENGNPLLSLPTGSGKSIVIAQFLKEACETYPPFRACVVTHVKELIAQNHEKLMALWPEAPAGLYSAGLGRRDTLYPILFCGIQSVYRRAKELGPWDAVLIDEVHRVSHRSESMYRTFLDDAEVHNPNLKVIGLSATCYRMGSGYLHLGKHALFDSIAYEQDLEELITEGFLSPLVAKHMHSELDTRGIHTRAGEFDQKELEKLVEDKTLLEHNIEEIIKHGEGRRSWLVFSCGVKHAQDIANELSLHGIKCAVVTGETPTEERDAVIDGYKAGAIKCLVNCNVLTTGFDAPETDLLACLRPTKSPGLWVQICGRGMRIAHGKTNCKVLDFGGNTARHGPINLIRVKQRGEGPPGVAPVKVCPVCESYLATAMRVCPDCGYEFPAPKKEIEKQASTLALIASKRQWVAVDRVNYYHHRKSGKPDSLRVVYTCGMSQFSSWVCVEHEGYARRKAAGWWAQRCAVPCPVTVEEALAMQDLLREPSRIEVDVSGEYPEITSYDFTVPVA